MRLFWAVEKIIGGVWYTDFLVDVILVTAGAGRFATFRVEALDCGGAGKHAIAGVAGNFDEKPWDRLGIRGRDGNGNFADYAAAVIGLPGRSSAMLADKLVLYVEELGVGSFQCPHKLPTATFATVNLVAPGVSL
jgi:hypothetical protein